MKKPEEIKKGNMCCGSGSCDGCPYRDAEHGGDSCCDVLTKDTLAYIQQLEREMNAMLASMKEDPHCCFHCNGIGCTTRKAKGDGSCFEWRGVEEDEHAQTD